MSFFTDYLKDAQNASAACDVLTSVILAQWADETRYGGSYAFVTENNYAGVSAGGSVNGFPTKEAGLSAYISCLNQGIYDGVRQANGWHDQCVALGESPWAGAKYDANDYNAGRPLSNPGVDLIGIVTANNLTQYDTGSTATGAGSVNAGFNGSPQGSPIAPPVPGFTSDISAGDIIINGTSLDLLVGQALVNAGLHLSLSQASTITLTLHDPDRVIITSPVFSQASQLNFDPYWFELTSVEKQGSVLTATFKAGIVAALGRATGAFTVTPGTMTRTQFAALLVGQIQGATFLQASQGYLYSLDQGYARNNQEQLSRGTLQSPLEDSWTCLQRLASEIQWVCFESFGAVYFGPYSYLVSLPAVMYPVEFQNGINLIDGTFDVGQPLGDLTVTAVADAWSPTIGQCVQINNLGPFSQAYPANQWIVSDLERPSITEPDITITLQQPLPGLPEPATGGAQAAVGSGAGNVQSTGGTTQAQAALAYALSKVGDEYSEASGKRLGPNSFDCSGLVFEAYLSAGVALAGTTTNGMWPSGAGAHVPDGAGNLQPGDLLFFGPAVGNNYTEHVAMVHTIDKATNAAICVQATDPQSGVQDNVSYGPVKVGTNFGPNLTYLGATRPAA